MVKVQDRGFQCGYHCYICYLRGWIFVFQKFKRVRDVFYVEFYKKYHKKHKMVEIQDAGI